MVKLVEKPGSPALSALHTQEECLSFPYLKNRSSSRGSYGLITFHSDFARLSAAGALESLAASMLPRAAAARALTEHVSRSHQSLLHHDRIISGDFLRYALEPSPMPHAVLFSRHRCQ